MEKWVSMAVGSIQELKEARREDAQSDSTAAPNVNLRTVITPLIRASAPCLSILVSH